MEIEAFAANVDVKGRFCLLCRF